MNLPDEERRGNALETNGEAANVPARFLFEFSIGK